MCLCLDLLLLFLDISDARLIGRPSNTHVDGYEILLLAVRYLIFLLMSFEMDFQDGTPHELLTTNVADERSFS